VKYALLIYDDDSAWADLPEDEKAVLRAEEMPKWVALFEELGKADPDVTGKELDGRATAKVVRIRDGERIVTDGPFAEAKELVGGFMIVSAESYERALQVAQEMPGLTPGASIEIREITA